MNCLAFSFSASAGVLVCGFGMSSQVPAEKQDRVEAFGRKHRTGLVTLLFTDMVESTALKQHLGDRAAADLFRKHHELIRETLHRFPQGEEIETAGDSFFLIFATPSDAVQFALLAQVRLRDLRPDSGASVLDRMGIHVGEVVVGLETGSLEPRGLFGVQIDTCSRVMSLAKAGQVLMTRAVFDSARQVLKGEDIPGVGQLEWLNHGPYLLKGLDEPVEVCEAREAGHETSGAPASSEKARRQARADEEPVLGWRPGIGQPVPNTRWVLEKKLGEGGFGEVWLGRNPTTKEARVFKFCFQAERVRFLKRELTLFRLLKERVGDHPHLVRLHDVFLDQPPFYVEMDYVEGADLRHWCEAHGGVEAIPLETRIEIVAQAADGLQAAHETGIVHRDIKPANILIGGRGMGPTEIQVKLTDFGIGQVLSEESLNGITRAGFTQTIMADSSSSHTGTQLYLAPELLAGKAASIRSDIYSLGVVLFQLLVGDLARPVTTDWAHDIPDALLRDDLQHCFAGHPQDRFVGVGQLARNLRTLQARRAELARREAEKRAVARAAYRRGVARTAGVAALIVALVAGLALMAWHQSRRARAETVKAAQAAAAEKQERQRAEMGERNAQRLLYAANMNLAQQAWERNNVERVRQLLDETAVYPERGFEWYYWQRQAHRELMTLVHAYGSRVFSASFSPDGRRMLTAGDDRTAKIWEAVSGRQLLTLKGHRAAIRSAAFSPDGQRMVTGGDDLEVRVWEVSSGKELLAFKGADTPIWCVAFSPDGRRLVTGSQERAAKVWETATGRELLTLNKEEEGGIWSAAFSTDGRRIVTGSEDGTARVWEAASGRQMLTLKGHSDNVLSVAFSPDGQRIVTGGFDRTAKVWEAASGKELLTLKGHLGTIWTVAFSPDSRRIVTGSTDRTAKVWEAASGQELLTFKGHGSGLRSVAFSPDAQRIITGSEDQTARVWEAASDQEAHTLKGHGAVIRSVAFPRTASGLSPAVRIRRPRSGKRSVARNF